jgi:GxxExxY protein
MSRLLHAEVTGAIIEAFYRVYNKLGYGFLEKVYENAPVIELGKVGLIARPQVPIKVFYENQLVGEYFADLLVADRVIVELKATDGLCDADEAQLLNYLKATTIEVGMLLNFGPRPEHRRKIFTNERKSSLTDDVPF